MATDHRRVNRELVQDVLLDDPGLLKEIIERVEICSEVVDRRILETRGVPSQQVSKRSRRANAGGKETPRCTEYIRTRGYAKSSCSTSTRLLEPERGGCSPRPSKQRSSSTSKLPEVSAMREGTPWW